MKKILILGMYLLNVSLSFCQTDVKSYGKAIVGQPCPDVLFNKVLNSSVSSLYIHELRGKWVILDFWSQHCAGCIGSFPRVSKMQQQFGDKVQFLMATYDDSNGTHREIFSRYNKKFNLQMPFVFNGNSEDKLTDLFQQFCIGGLPFIIVIDPEGIVKAITSHIEDSQIKTFLSGKIPPLLDATFSDNRASSYENKPYKLSVPFQTEGNGGGSAKDFQYRSLVASYDPKLKSAYDEKNDFTDENVSGNNPGRLEGIGMPLERLYSMAFWGKFNVFNFPRYKDRRLYASELVWLKPILEMRDTSQFVHNDVTGQNLYCYSLIVPPADGTRDNMMRIMQSDLKRFFKYEAYFEMRNMPYWKLVVIDSASVRSMITKGGVHEIASPINRVSIKFVNVPWIEFSYLIKEIANLDNLPFADATGIGYKVDGAFEYMPGDIVSINLALKKYGLQILKSSKMMKTLVIRDSKPETAAVN